jgi:Ca-activated chloride channel family protein
MVKLRYKQPAAEKSKLLELGVVDKGLSFADASEDLKFAAAVAGFGMLLRDSPHKGSVAYAGVIEIAEPALSNDPSGYRKEFLACVRQAQALGTR